MKIAGYDIKPVLLYLPDEQFWRDEHEAATVYLRDNGITDVEHIAGIHAHKFGVGGKHIYLLDGRPEEQFLIGDSKVGGFLSHYLLYCCMNVMQHSHYMVLEGDMRFADTCNTCKFTSTTGFGWRERLTAAMEDVPEDFDFLFLGSCCAEDKEPVHVKGDVYEFPYRGPEKWQYYPQCGHCYIVAKKCLPHLIATQRDTASPVDVSLIKYAFPQLKVYAVLPRLADQGSKTFLPM